MPITAEDERELVILAKAGDGNAAATLLKAHGGYLCMLAKTFRGELDDMMQEARFAALRALALFDPDRGIRFTTFAGRWVIWHLRAVRDRAGTIRTPQKCNLAKLKDRDKRRADRARQVASIDAPSGKGNRTFAGTLAAPNDTLASAAAGEDRERIRRALNRLNVRESDVIRRRMDGQTLESIGSQIGLTRERVRQIEAFAHHKLRKILTFARVTCSSD